MVRTVISDYDSSYSMSGQVYCYDCNVATTHEY